MQLRPRGRILRKRIAKNKQVFKSASRSRKDIPRRASLRTVELRSGSKLGRTSLRTGELKRPTFGIHSRRGSRINPVETDRNTAKFEILVDFSGSELDFRMKSP